MKQCLDHNRDQSDDGTATLEDDALIVQTFAMHSKRLNRCQRRKHHTRESNSGIATVATPGCRTSGSVFPSSTLQYVSVCMARFGMSYDRQSRVVHVRALAPVGTTGWSLHTSTRGSASSLHHPEFPLACITPMQRNLRALSVAPHGSTAPTEEARGVYVAGERA